jgi:hypothetical protein
MEVSHMHQFLSDQQLADMEERYKSLKKLLMMDMDVLFKEVREYRKILKRKDQLITAASAEKLELIKDDEVYPLPLKNRLDWPEMLKPADVQEILGIGRRRTYELLADPPFEVRRFGPRIIRISRDSLFSWIETRKDSSPLLNG